MTAVCLCGFVCLLGIVMCIVELAGMVSWIMFVWLIVFGLPLGLRGCVCVALVCGDGLLCMVGCVTCDVYLCLVLLPCRLVAGLWLGICYCLWFL